MWRNRRNGKGWRRRMTRRKCKGWMRKRINYRRGRCGRRGGDEDVDEEGVGV